MRLIIQDRSAFVNDFVRVVDEACGADVTFLVQGKLLGGFRNVLSLRCDLFKGMFDGEFREACDRKSPIPLPQFDGAFKAFREFLFFLHTSCATLEHVADIVDLYDIADYFQVQVLKERCLNYIREKTTCCDASYCAKMLTFAMKHEISDLLAEVVDFFSRNADSVLANASLAAKMPTSFLKFVFQSSDLSVSEMMLVNILLQSSATEESDLRNELIPLIRLPRIRAKDMMQIVKPSGLFSQDACMEAMAYQMDSTSVNLTAESTTDRKLISTASGFTGFTQRLLESMSMQVPVKPLTLEPELSVVLASRATLVAPKRRRLGPRA